jgi:hypothetical protein
MLDFNDAGEPPALAGRAFLEIFEGYREDFIETEAEVLNHSYWRSHNHSCAPNVTAGGRHFLAPDRNG